MEPHDERAPLEAIRRLLEVRRVELAERELRRWLSRHPYDAEGHGLLGWCLAVQKRGAQAIRSAREAVRLAPGMPYAHKVLATVLIRANRPREAEQSAREALALDPHDPESYALLVTALLDQTLRFRAREALRAAEAGLAVDPGHAECARLRAVALMRTFRGGEARKAAAYAVSLDPEGAETHATAGLIEFVLGDRRRSREHNRQALRIDPEHADAERTLHDAAEPVPFGAGMLVRIPRLLPRLLAIAAVLTVEIAALACMDPASLPSAAVLAGLYLTGLSVHVVWALLVHRPLIRRLRAPGGMGEGERREVDQSITIMFAVPLVIPPLLLLV